MVDRLEQAELDAIWNFDDPVASADRFAAAAAEPHRPELVRAELETQRARALGLQRRYDEADALLDLLGPATDTLGVRVLLERGRLRNSAGRAAEATALFEDALDAARREGETFLAVDAAHMLAISDPERSERWTAEAFDLLSGTSDPRTLRWSVALHNNRGWRLFEEGTPVSALAEFEAAVDAARAYGTDEQRFASEWTVARCLRELGRIHEAERIVRALADERPEDEAVAAELAALTDATHTIEP